MQKLILIIAGAAAVAVVGVSRQWDGGHGPGGAEMQNIACAEIVGEWEMFLEADESMPTGQLNMRTGGTTRFSLDDEGRVFAKDLDINRLGRVSDPDNPVIDVGRAYCSQSGSTFDLVRGGQLRMQFELNAAGELRRTGDDDGMDIVYRRPRPFWAF